MRSKFIYTLIVLNACACMLSIPIKSLMVLKKSLDGNKSLPSIFPSNVNLSCWLNSNGFFPRFVALLFLSQVLRVETFITVLRICSPIFYAYSLQHTFSVTPTFPGLHTSMNNNFMQTMLNIERQIIESLISICECVVVNLSLISPISTHFLFYRLEMNGKTSR